MKLSDLKKYSVVSNPTTVSTPQSKTVGQKILDTGTSVSNFFGGKGIADAIGATAAKAGASPDAKKYVEFPSPKQIIGSAIQLGANVIPGAGEAKLGTKILAGAGAGYAFDVGSKLQKDKTLGQSLVPGIGTAVGGGLPIAGAAIRPATAIISRLFKGLGSDLSGVSTDTIDSIVNNPKTAQKASDILAKTGNSEVLKKNAETIINGVSSIRQEARKAFGQGLETLSETDIKPTVFKDAVSSTLDKYGSVLEDGKRTLSNIEFNDPKNIQKASDLIDKLSNAKLDGKSLRKLSDDIENSAFKIATSDERLSFNHFIDDLSSTLTDAISQSTPKLDEINKAFHQDMELVDAVQNIFGKVNFKNLPEVVKASQKLEGLFAQKGLAPDVVNSFLKRIGESPADFKTTEAIRQISNKEGKANSVGTSLGEIMRSTTSAVITPKMIKNLSIVTGLAKEKITPFLNSLKPAARNIVIQALLQSNQDSSKK